MAAWIEFRIEFTNSLDELLHYESHVVRHGEVTRPPELIPPFSTVEILATSDGLMTGASGDVVYRTVGRDFNARFRLNWNDPFIGANTIVSEISGSAAVAQEFEITQHPEPHVNHAHAKASARYRVTSQPGDFVTYTKWGSRKALERRAPSVSISQAEMEDLLQNSNPKTVAFRGYQAGVGHPGSGSCGIAYRIRNSLSQLDRFLLNGVHNPPAPSPVGPVAVPQEIGWLAGMVVTSPRPINGALVPELGDSIFVVNSKGSLYWFLEDSPFPWVPCGEPVHPIGEIDACSSRPGRYDVVFCGIDGNIYHGWNESASGDRTLQWENLGGADLDLIGSPSISSPHPGRQDVFVRTAQNQMAHRWIPGAWEVLECSISSDPIAVAYTGYDEPEFVTSVFFRAVDGTIAYLTSFEGFGWWQGPRTISGQFEPTSFHRGGGNDVYLFRRDRGVGKVV